MSNEEAIRIIVDLIKTIKVDGRTYIAFEMAVRALWAQERGDKDDNTISGT